MKVSVKILFTDRRTYRTPVEELDGMPEMPSIGKSLLLTSSTFESGGIITSEVTDHRSVGNEIYVKTNNNVYVITKLGE